MLDVADILDDPDFQETFEVERRKAGVDQSGRLRTESEKFLITGCIQPATARELERLAEADRSGQTLAVYTKAPLYISDQDRAADIIRRQGKAFEVTAVEEWPGWFRALARELNEQRTL